MKSTPQSSGGADRRKRFGTANGAMPWWWADASDNNTVDIAGLPPGEHNVTIALVDANHNVIPGQVVTLPFTVPASAPTQHVHVAK